MNDFRGLFIGLTTVDIQYFVDYFPEPNKKIKTVPPEIFVGGPATNASIAFAKLNGNAFLASTVGRNDFRTFIKDDFTATAVKHFDFMEHVERNPVLSTVITSRNNGDRNIFTHEPENFRTEIKFKKLITNVKPQILLLDGFYPDFAIKAAATARQLKVPVVLDCGSWKSQHEDLLKCVDIVICSEDFYPPGCRTSNEVFTFLKTYGIQHGAISRGEKNILYYDRNVSGEINVEKTNVIDTLGAGDFLHGAFCFYYLERDTEFKQALYKASKLASKSCEYAGTRSWLDVEF